MTNSLLVLGLTIKLLLVRAADVILPWKSWIDWLAKFYSNFRPPLSKTRQNSRFDATWEESSSLATSLTQTTCFLKSGAIYVCYCLACALQSLEPGLCALRQNGSWRAYHSLTYHWVLYHLLKDEPYLQLKPREKERIYQKSTEIARIVFRKTKTALWRRKLSRLCCNFRQTQIASSNSLGPVPHRRKRMQPCSFWDRYCLA